MWARERVSVKQNPDEYKIIYACRLGSHIWRGYWAIDRDRNMWIAEYEYQDAGNDDDVPVLENLDSFPGIFYLFYRKGVYIRFGFMGVYEKERQNDYRELGNMNFFDPIFIRRECSLRFGECDELWEPLTDEQVLTNREIRNQFYFYAAPNMEFPESLQSEKDEILKDFKEGVKYAASISFFEDIPLKYNGELICDYPRIHRSETVL